MADSVPYTNGHSSPVASDTAMPSAPSPPSEDACSETQEAAAASSDGEGDADADGEEYEEDEPMEVDAETSEDAEGEADSDFGSDSPPPEEDRRRARSSTSQASSPRSKRKASVEDDFQANPELYGLRRSVRSLFIHRTFQLIVNQGRARPTRRIVGTLAWFCTSL
jgi:chromodomain-helicase-DNA-binding protein 1